jgi:hypothetical protein
MGQHYFNESGSVIGGGPGSILNDLGDIAFAVDYDFSLKSDEFAVATFVIQSVAPTMGLQQWDDDTGEYVYLASSLDITTVPEPATMLLLGTGIVWICAAKRKKLFKK